jgi:hypothetical protein
MADLGQCLVFAIVSQLDHLSALIDLPKAGTYVSQKAGKEDVAEDRSAPDGER